MTFPMKCVSIAVMSLWSQRSIVFYWISLLKTTQAWRMMFFRRHYSWDTYLDQSRKLFNIWSTQSISIFVHLCKHSSLLVQSIKYKWNFRARLRSSNLMNFNSWLNIHYGGLGKAVPLTLQYMYIEIELLQYIMQ